MRGTVVAAYALTYGRELSLVGDLETIASLIYVRHQSTVLPLLKTQTNDLRSARELSTQTLHDLMGRQFLGHLKVHILRIARCAQRERRGKGDLHVRVKTLRICHGKPCALARADKEVCIVEMGDVTQLLPLRDESTIVYGRTFLRYTPL